MNDATMAGGDSADGDSRISTRREKEWEGFERDIKRMFARQTRDLMLAFAGLLWIQTMLLILFLR